jgi:hypothetical protein
MSYAVIFLLAYFVAIIYVWNYAQRSKQAALRQFDENGLSTDDLLKKLRESAPRTLLIRPVIVMGSALGAVGALVKWVLLG